MFIVGHDPDNISNCSNDEIYSLCIILRALMNSVYLCIQRSTMTYPYTKAIAKIGKR